MITFNGIVSSCLISKLFMIAMMYSNVILPLSIIMYNLKYILVNNMSILDSFSILNFFKLPMFFFYLIFVSHSQTVCKIWNIHQKIFDLSYTIFNAVVSASRPHTIIVKTIFFQKYSQYFFLSIKSHLYRPLHFNFAL